MDTMFNFMFRLSIESDTLLAFSWLQRASSGLLHGKALIVKIAIGETSLSKILASTRVHSFII